MNTEHLYLVCVSMCVYLHPCIHTWVYECVYLCAQHLSGPRRLERNSQSGCQDSQTGCELLSQKIDPVPARSDRPSIPNSTVCVCLCVLSVMCQVSIGVLWGDTIGKREVRVHVRVMTKL